jgi:hypothetical protein
MPDTGRCAALCGPERLERSEYDSRIRSRGFNARAGYRASHGGESKGGESDRLAALARITKAAYGCTAALFLCDR